MSLTPGCTHNNFFPYLQAFHSPGQQADIPLPLFSQLLSVQTLKLKHCLNNRPEVMPEMQNNERHQVSTIHTDAWWQIVATRLNVFKAFDFFFII